MFTGSARAVGGLSFLQCHYLTPRVLPRLNTRSRTNKGQPVRAKMKIAEALLASVMVCATLATTATAADTPSRWAYIEDNPNYKPPVDDGNLVRVPNSTAGYTWTQLRTRFIAPIWHPGDHAPLPDIVANGRKPDVFACGFCHRADGPGGPENADLAGLPKNYIIRQMADYKSGARSTAVPGRLVACRRA
jgi:cytochrome c553